MVQHTVPQDRDTEKHTSGIVGSGLGSVTSESRSMVETKTRGRTVKRQQYPSRERKQRVAASFTIQGQESSTKPGFHLQEQKPGFHSQEEQKEVSVAPGLTNDGDMNTRNSGVKYNRLSGIQTPQNECLRCNKLFKTTSGLSQHIESSHKVTKNKETGKPTVYTCEQCEMTFSADSQLQQHVSAKHGKAKCNICFNHFETHEHLQKHIRKKHSDTLDNATVANGDCNTTPHAADEQTDTQTIDSKPTTNGEMAKQETSVQFQSSKDMNVTANKVATKNDDSAAITSNGPGSSNNATANVHITKQVTPTKTEKNPLSGDFCCFECHIGFRSAAGLARHVGSAHQTVSMDGISNGTVTKDDLADIQAEQKKPMRSPLRDKIMSAISSEKRNSLLSGNENRRSLDSVAKRNSFVLGEKRNSLVLLKRASLDMDFRAEAHIVENRKSRDYSFTQVKADVEKKLSALWTKSTEDAGNVTMHKCHKCSEMFASINLLHNHNVAEHPLKCSFCINKFPNSESLNVHMIAKHPEIIDAQKGTPLTRSTDRLDRTSWHLTDKQADRATDRRQQQSPLTISTASPTIMPVANINKQTNSSQQQQKQKQISSPLQPRAQSPQKKLLISPRTHSPQKSPQIRNPATAYSSELKSSTSSHKQQPSPKYPQTGGLKSSQAPVKQTVRHPSPNKRHSSPMKPMKDGKDVADKPVKCPDCNHFFKNKEVLQIHSKGAHNKCSFCHQMFDSAEEMAIHMTKAHPLGKQFTKRDSKSKLRIM